MSYKKMPFIKRMLCPQMQLEKYYIGKRKYDYENNVPIQHLSRNRMLHNIVVFVVKLDLLFNRQKLIIQQDRHIDTERPKIYACTHIGRWDIEQTILAIKEHSYIFFGDPGRIYKSVNGLLLEINGVIYVELDNKTDRMAGKESAKKLLKQGGNLIIFPEGAWNITSNLPVMKLYRGAVEMAIETGADIVPIAIEQYGNNYIFNIGENIRYNGDTSLVGSETEKLRDVLCSLKWEIWADKRIYRREDIPVDAKEQFIHSIMDYAINDYTIDKIEKRRFLEKHEEYRIH